MRIRRVLLVLAVLILAALACETPGQAQAPITVVVTVIASQAPGGQPVDTTTATVTEASTVAASENVIQGKATTQVAIRKHPGPGCEIIGYVEKDETVNFLLRTDFEPHWYQTDKLGPENKGWVYHEYFSLLQEDHLPRVPEQGCLYCGDGVCTASIGEACDVCTADCGVCPKCGDGAVNQSSEQCDGDPGVCPVSGSKCNANCQCVAPKPKCGDGKINQPTEQCDGSSAGCPSKRYTCTERCTCVPPLATQEPVG